MGIPHWLKIVAKIAPQILALTPLAPIAPAVAAAIAEAEQMPGKSGAEKLAHVVNVAGESADALAAAGVQIDPAAVRAAAAGVISTVVDVTNIHKIAA